MSSVTKCRVITFYRDYFQDFFRKQPEQVREKILWTFKLVEELEHVPACYLKYLVGTEGLYEIRVQCGNNIYRAFCFFDEGRLVIVINGFQKKTQKTPDKELRKAITIKKQYYEEKNRAQTPR